MKTTIYITMLLILCASAMAELYIPEKINATECVGEYIVTINIPHKIQPTNCVQDKDAWRCECNKDLQLNRTGSAFDAEIIIMYFNSSNKLPETFNEKLIKLSFERKDPPTEPMSTDNIMIIASIILAVLFVVALGVIVAYKKLKGTKDDDDDKPITERMENEQGTDGNTTEKRQ